MSKFSLSVYLNAYSDAFPSNQPGQNNFRWNRDLNSILVNNPTQIAARVAPGSTLSLFNGMRTLAQDSTTQYSIALAPLQTSIYALTAVAGTLPNFRTPRAVGADATTQVDVVVNGPIVTFIGVAGSDGTQAEFVGLIGGMTTSVTIGANTPGVAGNITLPIDGVSSIGQLISNWNTAHPSNTLSVIGDDSQIPTGGEFVLTGGTNPITALNVSAAQVGDYVTIRSNFNPLNQGTFQIIALTTNSLTVENITGSNEGPITLGSSFASQISIFSAAGVQVGDTLNIYGGFSEASWGSYEITAVTAESIQFSSTSPLPQEGPIMTEDITIYSNAKTLVYIESDSTLDVILNTVDIGQIEPFMISNANLPSLPLTAIPGIFMLKSIVYSLAVTNNGINPANITFLAVE